LPEHNRALDELTLLVDRSRARRGLGESRIVPRRDSSVLARVDVPASACLGSHPRSRDHSRRFVLRRLSLHAARPATVAWHWASHTELRRATRQTHRLVEMVDYWLPLVLTEVGRPAFTIAPKKTFFSRPWWANVAARSNVVVRR